ncbi:polysaccharide pyruvyl transferase family protein [Longispora albida]|uniref:polysaccharide pyruvyl transferase family protein n=1 Tax=Longispora albida TaxID=203523 RepID=UPI00036CDDDE|nr:polysaccharide pyruvyl transferase family protein [Longispora albida]
MKVALFGSNGEARNRGVAALATATATGILSRVPGAEVSWYDDGWGVRPDAKLPGVTRVGARLTRRYHRPESYHHMAVSARLGGVGNPGAARLNAADAVLDTSGGDSFTDLYSPVRWRLVNWPKKLAVARKRPLIFLPQTYGPFHGEQTRREARELVLASAAAWARDADSFARLQELAGEDFDPDKHRQGVDVAFALPPKPFEDEVLEAWLARNDDPVAVLNISGLLLDPSEKRFGLTADLRAVVDGLAKHLLDEGARLLFVPHVSAPGTRDDDDAITARLVGEFGAEYGPDRVAAGPSGLDCQESKWLISRADWLCGMRMHATIAALSSAVPASCVAYSDKARGVFATAGQGHRVADARKLGTEELLAELLASWLSRETTKEELATGSAQAVAAAGQQLDDLVALIGRLERRNAHH